MENKQGLINKELINQKLTSNLLSDIDIYPLIPDNPYLLLTPGPLSTSKSVRAAMLFDLCTWDSDYKELTQKIRKKLINFATKNTEKYTAVLMQGSGTFCVEAVLGSVISKNSKLLILSNGEYGKRIEQISKRLNLNYLFYSTPENQIIDINSVENIILENEDITHVAFVHCETTTGILNPLEKISKTIKKYNKKIILDAMSSFGGIEFDIDLHGIDFMISSANKCIEGVPGFAFVIANKDELEKTCGVAPSLSLDIYDQWKEMEKDGKWRFTSPTHSVRAFYQALLELEQEGGIKARNKRYKNNQRHLVEGMEELGFKCLIAPEFQSPIITSFLYPESIIFNFDKFYLDLKRNGFVIYPGKISTHDTFRIGNIGKIYKDDIDRLLNTIRVIKFW